MWCSRRSDTSGVRLYKYDGTYWKTVKNTNGKATFPAVNLGTDNIVLGWSKTQGKNTLSSVPIIKQETVLIQEWQILYGCFWNVYGSRTSYDYKTNKI